MNYLARGCFSTSCYLPKCTLVEGEKKQRRNRPKDRRRRRREKKTHTYTKRDQHIPFQSTDSHKMSNQLKSLAWRGWECTRETHDNTFFFPFFFFFFCLLVSCALRNAQWETKHMHYICWPSGDSSSPPIWVYAFVVIMRWILGKKKGMTHMCAIGSRSHWNMNINGNPLTHTKPLDLCCGQKHAKN